MSTSIHALIPNPDDLLALEPEELAGVVLEHLNTLAEKGVQLNRYNFSLHHTVAEYPREYHARLSQALMEAWVWLEREGLIVPMPEQSGEWVVISRRGQRMKKAADVEAYRRANLLPRGLLHPLIAQKVWVTFLRGDYDTAVFQAFKEVEIRVREIGKFSANDLGTGLMRKAFHPNTGPLTDTAAVPAEQEALMHLFSGAIGSYKNPSSHRHVGIEPDEAVEMIVLASHLLRIADSRA